MMQKRKLGNNGPMVSAVGLGAWSFGGAYGPTDEAESHATLAGALELGIDFLDTANVYGNGISETVIGTFIRDHPGRFKIATKAGIWRHPETNQRGFNNSPEHLREELEKSLTRLGVDHVDLFYVHRRDYNLPIEEVTGTLVRFIDEGKIGGIGFSEIAPWSLRRAASVHPVMAVQSEYSLWTRSPEVGVIRACKDLGTAFVPFSPLGRGMFVTDPPDPAIFADNDFRKNNPRFVEPNFSANLRALEPFREFAAARGANPAALAVAWTLTRGDHLIPIPGTRSLAHLKHHAEGGALTLSAGDLAEIDRILPPGFAHGDRYSDAQWPGAERYC